MNADDIRFFIRTTGERELNESYGQIEYTLLVDKEHKPIDSFIEQLEYISQWDAVLLEDDVWLCDDFKDELIGVLNGHEGDVVNFFYEPHEYFSSHYFQGFKWNQCTYYPKGVGKTIAEHMRRIRDTRRLLKRKELPYDLLEGAAMKTCGKLMYAPRPCIVQHMPMPSLIQSYKDIPPKRLTIYFVDYLKKLGVAYEDAYDTENKAKLTRERDEFMKSWLEAHGQTLK